jgi:hypothetical protein
MKKELQERPDNSSAAKVLKQVVCPKEKFLLLLGWLF